MKKIILLLISIYFFLQFHTDSYSQMFWNYSGKFDTNTVLSYVNSASLNITGSFTIEVWLNPFDTVTTNGGAYNRQKQIVYKENYNITLQHGKPRLYINGSPVLTFKNGIAPNQWNHVAFTYNTTGNVFSGYLNGQLDTSRTFTAVPLTSSEDLFIGSNPNLTSSLSKFTGYMDDVRIWNKPLTQTEISTYFRTVIGVKTGTYSGLILSLSFQHSNSVFIPPTTDDLTETQSTGNEIGVLALDQKSRPLETVSFNEALELDGNGDYAAAASNSSVTPASALTIEAWVYIRSLSGAIYIITKGPSNLTNQSYSLGINVSGRLFGIINNQSLTTTTTIPLNEWVHVAFQYRNIGEYRFFKNGEIIHSGFRTPGDIISNSDSLYIGGTLPSSPFDGFIDEVRIQKFYKSQTDIQKSLYISKDIFNKNPSFDDIVFNLDGLSNSSTSSTVKLSFRGNARFSHPSTISNQPVSPITRADDLNFMNGFHIKQSDRLIPASGTSGLMTEDSMYIELNETISDVNFFIATNHTFSNDLEITLVSPYGYEAFVCFDAGQLGANDNIITIFDDQADSSIVNGKYTCFAPKIKPQVDLNATLGGNSSKGIWKLRINDDNSGNTGRLYAWGVQINNAVKKKNLLATNCLMQGFYNAGTNSMVRDTMRFYLRSFYSPYALRDSAKDYLGTLGGADLVFNNTDTGKYYIQLKHRNSIETWSSSGIVLNTFTMQNEYNFKDDINSAFGSNMIQVDASPLRYAVYSGDVNQDGVIDASDNGSIDNDAANFATGYLSTDLNGDEVIDASDAAIADNNAANFVSAITP